MNLFELDFSSKLSKTVRVLMYPNITFQKDLNKDSYIKVASNQIKLLNEIRNDLWFYCIVPRPISLFEFLNVTQLTMDIPTYPQAMRSHFNVPDIQKLLDHKYDFDLVMSHLPEHTHALKNVMYNITHHRPPFFGYCHWFDLDEVVSGPKDTFLQNIWNLLEFDRCYLNTQQQKNMVLIQAKRYFKDTQIKKLDEILVPQLLGVNETDIINTPMGYKKIIVFNHRPDTYKHFNHFISLMDKLYEKREDFQVWIPLLEKPNRKYVFTTKVEDEQYNQILKTCCVGYSPKQKYGGWSVATTDGMRNGVPYIMYDGEYYRELWNEGHFVSTDDETIDAFNRYLDDVDFRNTQSTKGIEHLRKHLIYKDKMIEMSDYMDSLLSSVRVVGDTQALQKIIDFIKRKKKITKADIMKWETKWGRGLPWTQYRRALLNHPNIYDSMTEFPTYCWE